MERSEDTVSVVIVSWNCKKYLLECLTSLRNPEIAPSPQIILVDNASDDGTVESVTQQFPDVTVIRNDANLGFARANNVAISHCRGRYICLLNPDVVMPCGCMEKMIEYMDSHRDIGMLGPKMLSPTGGLGDSVMKFPTLWNTLCCSLGLHRIVPRSKHFGGFMMAAFPYDQTVDVDVLTGWFWMVRREALFRVGGLDERFFMYGEDIDWCHRFHQAGWRVVFYADAAALHYGAASSSQAPSRFYVEMRRANYQYFQKYHGRIASLGFLWATWVHELTRLIAYGFAFYILRTRHSETAMKLDRSLSSLKWLWSSLSTQRA